MEADILVVAWLARFSSSAWRMEALARRVAIEGDDSEVSCKGESRKFRARQSKEVAMRTEGTTAAVTCKVAWSLSIKICGGGRWGQVGFTFGAVKEGSVARTAARQISGCEGDFFISNQSCKGRKARGLAGGESCL